MVLLFFLSPSLGALERVDPSERFLVAEAPSLSFIFPESLRPLLPQAVWAGEEAMTRLEKFFGRGLSYKPQVVLLDSSDLANGFADPQMGKVVVFVSWPLEHLVGTRFGDWLSLVLTHELAHLFQTGFLPEEDWWRVFLGKVFPPGGLQPMWFMEGYAVYSESRLSSRGGRLDDPLFDSYLRKEVEEGLKSLSFFGGYGFVDEWPGALGCYLYGASICGYLVERFGDEVLRNIIALQNRTANPFDLKKAVREATGFSFDEIVEDWRKSLKERYKREDTKTSIVSLPGGGFYLWGIASSSCGRFLVYAVSGPQRLPGLRLLDLVSGKEKLLARGRIVGRPAFSPDGTKLVYGKIVESTFADYADLFLYDLVKRKEVRLTKKFRAFSPVFWGEDRVLFLSRKGGREGLWALELPGGHTSLVHVFDPSFHPVSVAISGHLLAISGWNKGYLDVALFDLENRTFSFLFEDRFGDLYPAFSLEGDFLYFTSDRSGTYELYAYSLRDGTLFRLTDEKDGIFEVTFSGEKVYCVFLGSGGYHVGLLNPEEFFWEKVKVRSEPAREIQPTFEAPHTVSPYRALWRFYPFVSLEGWGMYGEDALRRQVLLLEGRSLGDWVLQYENRLLFPELILWTHLGEKEEGLVTLRFTRLEGYARSAFSLSWGRLAREDEVFQGMEEGWWGNLVLENRGGTTRFLRSSEGNLHLFFGRRGEEEGFRVIAGQKSTLSYEDKELALSLFWGYSSFPSDFGVGEGPLVVRGYSGIRGEEFLLGKLSYAFPIRKLYAEWGPLWLKDIRGRLYLQGVGIFGEEEGKILGTFGCEVILRSFLGNDALPFQVKAGVSFPLSGEGAIELYLTVGSGL